VCETVQATSTFNCGSNGYYKPPSGTGGTATNFDVNMAVSSGGGTKASSTQYFELYDYYGANYRWLSSTFSNVQTDSSGTFSFSGTGVLYICPSGTTCTKTSTPSAGNWQESYGTASNPVAYTVNGDTGGVAAANGFPAYYIRLAYPGGSKMCTQPTAGSISVSTTCPSSGRRLTRRLMGWRARW